MFNFIVVDFKSANRLLRLLVDNELFRLNVWDNPANDLKRNTDHICALEREMLDVCFRMHLVETKY